MKCSDVGFERQVTPVLVDEIGVGGAYHKCPDGKAFKSDNVLAREIIFGKVAKVGSSRFVCAFVFVTLWWTAAIVVIVVIKRTVSTGGIYPYPFAFTSLTQAMTGFVAWLLSRATAERHRPPLPSLSWREVGTLSLLGVLQGVDIGFTNKALEYLTVASRTIIGSCTVLFMMLTAWFWGLERLGCLRVCSGTLLIFGGMLQGLDHMQSGQASQMAGVLLQLGSMIVTSQRWALAQYVLQRSPHDSALGSMSKLQLLAYTLPVNDVVCIPLALLFEASAPALSQLMQTQLLVHVLAISFGLVVMLYAELKLVQILSAVAFNVLSAVHQIPIIFAGVILQNDRVDGLAALGFGCGLAGAVVYAAARQAERSAEAEWYEPSPNLNSPLPSTTSDTSTVAAP